MFIAFKLIPLLTRLIQDIIINYAHNQFDVLLHWRVPPALLLRYSTNFHLEAQDLNTQRQFVRMLQGNTFLQNVEEFYQVINSGLFLEEFYLPISSCSSFLSTIFLNSNFVHSVCNVWSRIYYVVSPTYIYTYIYIYIYIYIYVYIYIITYYYILCIT